LYAKDVTRIDGGVGLQRGIEFLLLSRHDLVSGSKLFMRADRRMREGRRGAAS
jgi:hypothetical protein